MTKNENSSLITVSFIIIISISVIFAMLSFLFFLMAPWLSVTNTSNEKIIVTNIKISPGMVFNEFSEIQAKETLSLRTIPLSGAKSLIEFTVHTNTGDKTYTCNIDTKEDHDYLDMYLSEKYLSCPPG